jgi:hypothetical protein
MKTLLYFLVLVVAGVTRGQTFTLTEQDYDTSSASWKAPRMTALFWRNAQGTYDSVHTAETLPSKNIRRMYDWRKVSTHVRPQAYNILRPYFLLDLKLNEQVPRFNWRYSTRSGDTTLWQFDSLEMKDSLILSHYGFDSTYIGQPAIQHMERYTYTERPEVSLYVSYNLEDSTDRPIMFGRDRTYDGNGKLVQAITKQIPNPTWRYDSALFEYGVDGALTKATHYHIMEDRIVEILRHEYNGWYRMQSETHPFVDGYTVAGGDEFDEEITYGRDPESNQDSVYMVRKQWYNQDGRVSSGYSEYHGTKYGYEISYYPNGDVRLSRNVTISGGDSSVRVTEYKNTYIGGLLHECIIVKDSVPFRRYEINYSASAVREDKTRLLSQTSFGRTIELPISTSPRVRLVNVLGTPVQFTLQGSKVNLPDLPSGLYFISIDGGKPRKHLIP